MALLTAPSIRHDVWIKTATWLSQLAPTTQSTYLSIIREYSSFLGAVAGTAAAAELLLASEVTHALAYTLHLKRQRGQTPRLSKIARRQRTTHNLSLSVAQSPATMAKKIMCLRRLYSVLQAHDLYTKPNPFSPHLVPVPNARGGRKRDTLAVPETAVPSLLSAIEDGPRATRDRAILSVLFGGGLRRGELVKLLMDDLCMSPGGTSYLRLRNTKDGTDADQALPDWAAQPLWELKEERIAQGAAADDPLFVSWTGRGGLIPTDRPMDGATVYHVFKGACVAAGLDPLLYSPHSARATAITKLLADGTPHREVQEFSRHKSVTMVEWYDKRRFGVDESPARRLSFDIAKKKQA